MGGLGDRSDPSSHSHAGLLVDTLNHAVHFLQQDEQEKNSLKKP